MLEFWATFLQNLMQVKIKLFQVRIKLSAINNSQFLLEMGISNNQTLHNNEINIFIIA